MKQTRIHLQWREAPVGQFRSGVSLHSHTLHSQETLDFIYRLAHRIGCIRWVLRQGEAQYRKRHGCQLDLARAWWTPPCAPYDAWLLEKKHIEQHFGLHALVSLTDHDSIEAPLSLRALESCRELPVSLEWTVPCGGTFFHLGVHNLKRETAPEVFQTLQGFTARREKPNLADILHSLTQEPETLIVFNHPCWDEQGIGAEGHAEAAGYFARRYGPYIHALELNGLRPWNENRRVIEMARALGKPTVSDGDRHALEANTILDLTNAATFSEYVEQVRSGFANVLVTNPYREPFGLRILRSLEEILQDYGDHASGWRSWSDRVFYRCDDGVVRCLTALFPRGAPPAIQFFVKTVGLIRQCGVQRTFRMIMANEQEFAL
jgi:hypothetical protein